MPTVRAPRPPCDCRVCTLPHAALDATWHSLITHTHTRTERAHLTRAAAAAMLPPTPTGPR